MNQIDGLIDEIVRFRDERDWGQFHTPRHLAAALSIEASELLQEFLWKSDDEVETLVAGSEGRASVTQELADVLIFSLLLCEELKIDPDVAIREKLRINANKYPVDQARSSARKYTELGPNKQSPGPEDGR